MKEIMMEKEVEGKHVEKMVPENLASIYEKAGWTIQNKQPKSQEEQPKSFSNRNLTSKETNE